MVNRALLLLLIACGRPPEAPSPAHLRVVASVTTDAATLPLLNKVGALDWVFSERWVLDGNLRLRPREDALALAKLRALHTGPALGVIGCSALCANELEVALGDAAARARLELRLLRETERERVDGIALDLTSLTLEPSAVAFVEEMGAACHASSRALGVFVRMTCRDRVCAGLDGLDRVALAADALVIRELDSDRDPAPEAWRSALTPVPREARAKLFLDAAGADDAAARAKRAAELGLGGVHAGRLGEDPACVLDVARAVSIASVAPVCP